MLEDGRLAGGDAMRRVQTERMDGHEGRIKQDALLRGGRSSPLHNLNQDRRVRACRCSGQSVLRGRLYGRSRLPKVLP